MMARPIDWLTKVDDAWEGDYPEVVEATVNETGRPMDDITWDLNLSFCIYPIYKEGGVEKWTIEVESTGDEGPLVILQGDDIPGNSIEPDWEAAERAIKKLVRKAAEETEKAYFEEEYEPDLG